MGWHVRIGDHDLDIDRMPPTDMAQLCAAAGVKSWFDLWPMPLKDLASAEKLLRHMARKHKQELPSPLTIEDLLGFFRVEEDDLPKAFEDGIPKSVPAETPTIDGSSGSPATSSGPPTSRGRKPRGTSSS